MTHSLGCLLVVDDEAANREMLSRRLEIEGYTVRTAADGAQAIRMLSESDFDAVLLDVMMPVQDGYEVLAEIRKSRTSLELPVLMVTPSQHAEDIVQAFAGGANDCITTPINFPIALARISSHITSKKLSDQLRESEARYSLSARGANDGLWDWDLRTDKVYFSPRWKSMLGYQPEEIGELVEEWFQRIHADDLPHVKRALELHRSGLSEQFESEHRMLHRDQTYHWVLTRGVATSDASGQISRMAGSLTDITRGKAADPLTGLPNRVLFMDHLDAAIKAFQNQPEFLYAVLFVDLDRFKIVNDSLGHQAGDELLVTVARRLESCMRSSDVVSRLNERCTVARFGGDEFVILLKGIRDPENACHVADRVLAVLSEPLTILGQTVCVSGSIGIAIGTSSMGCAHDLLRDADTAMYEAKANGKSRACLFNDAMRARAVERLALETDLRRGLLENEFELYYQPIVSLESEQIEGFEALLRWQHPERGLIGPSEFIPIAEETGFIIELGAWGLEQACRQLCIWQLEYPSPKPLFVSVNVASKQFTDPKLVDRVQFCLDQNGLDASCLKLEITESAVMTNVELATRTLRELQAIGVRISLDEFGTGYSSLSYLQQLPIDTLKIDRSFIERIEGSSQAEEIVRTIVGLAHGLGMRVTAEGVECQAQSSILQAISCETVQGFFYSRPEPKSSIDALLKSNACESLPKYIPVAPRVPR